MGRPILCVLLILLFISLKTHAQQVLRPAPDSFVYNSAIRILPQNFYNQHVGFFCKKESQLHQQVRLPVYIRLGSKAYVDYLEQKPNSRKW